MRQFSILMFYGEVFKRWPQNSKKNPHQQKSKTHTTNQVKPNKYLHLSRLNLYTHTPFCLCEATDGALICMSLLLWFRIAKLFEFVEKITPNFCPFPHQTSRHKLSPAPALQPAEISLVLAHDSPNLSLASLVLLLLLSLNWPHWQPCLGDGPYQERKGWRRSAKPGRATGKGKMPRGPDSSQASNTSILIASFQKVLHYWTLW